MKVSMTFLVVFAAVCVFTTSAQLVDDKYDTEDRLLRSIRRSHLPRPTQIPNYNRGKREVNPVLDGENGFQILHLRLTRSNGRPHLPRPTQRPNYNRGKREVNSEPDLENDSQVLQWRHHRPEKRGVALERDTEDDLSILELRVRRSNGRPYLPRPTQRPSYNREKIEVNS